MSAKLFARSLYLTVVLIVTMAIGGCIPVASFHEGAKSSALEKGKTTRAGVLEMFDNPDAKTFDGRFFLYAYHKETVWLDLISILSANIEDGRLLIEFDETKVVKEYSNTFDRIPTMPFYLTPKQDDFNPVPELQICIAEALYDVASIVADPGT